MEASKLKNMVVLKNLPSNLVDEAIIILKANKRVKKLEKLEKLENSKDKNNTMESQKERKRDDSYILKEAEMLVSDYIVKLENNKNKKMFEQKNQSKKYKKLKKYAYISTIIIFIETLAILIK